MTATTSGMTEHRFWLTMVGAMIVLVVWGFGGSFFLNGDAQVTSNVRLFLQVGVWEEEGRDERLPTDRSAADVSQAFVELSGTFAGG